MQLGWDNFDDSLYINNNNMNNICAKKTNNMNNGFHVEANINEGSWIDIHLFELGLYHHYHCKGGLVKTLLS